MAVDTEHIQIKRKELTKTMMISNLKTLSGLHGFDTILLEELIAAVSNVPNHL